MGRTKVDKIQRQETKGASAKSRDSHRTNTPARSARQVTKRVVREQQPRVQQAAEEARQAQAALERALKAEAPGPAAGAVFHTPAAPKVKTRSTVWIRNWLHSGVECDTCKTSYSECTTKQQTKGRPCCSCCAAEPQHGERRERERHLFEPYEGDPKEGYTIGQVRRLIAQGYHVTAIMRRTGCGFKWLEDLVGEDGYAKC